MWTPLNKLSLVLNTTPTKPDQWKTIHQVEHQNLLHNKLIEIRIGKLQVKQTRMSTKFANHFQRALLVITTSLVIVSCQWSPQPLVLVETTIGEIQHALVTRATTCHEVVSTYLQRIESYDKSSGNVRKTLKDCSYT